MWEKNPKRHFVDPSLGCAALNITPEKLMNDLNTFGLYLMHFMRERLENLCESIECKVISL